MATSAGSIDGIVIQERAGETTLLAVGFDVRVTEPRGVTDLSVVVEPVGTSTEP